MMRRAAMKMTDLKNVCIFPEDVDQYAVFNLHSKTWHLVPPPTPRRMDMKKTTYGMINTSEIPYSFKLILGSTMMKTPIYESKTGLWSERSSKLQAKTYSFASSFSTCAYNNGNVYVSQQEQRILVYSIEGDIWTTLRGTQPHLDDDDDEVVEHNRCSLGVWKGRIFTFREIEDDHVSV